MIDSKPEGREKTVSGGKSRWLERGVLGVVCALVIGIYAAMAQSGLLECLSLNAADTYYNLLVQGFRAGQLSLKKEVPPGFAQLADPYDPTANALYRSESYRMLDMSYYRGRLYFYFGVTPALILFWPFTALTGHYLFHREAVAIFCALGFLASVGLLCALWRRYFADVNVWVVAACVLALGLATGVPVLLSRSDAYEVPISCGYMLVMVALGAIWCALHKPERRWQWLTAASVAYGLAVGARPTLLFGAVILLVPVAQSWCERRPIGTLLAAAIVPISLIGFGLMFYNALRFDSPFEFGVRYQLAADQRETRQCFSLRYLWFNFRVYFLETVRWSPRFPFVRDIAVPPVPPGHHGNVEKPFGVLTNIPLVWVAVLASLAWRNRSAQARSILRGFLTAVTLLFGIVALTLGVYYSSANRFEVEFLPAMVLLAVAGILGLEQALAERPVWRRAARWTWGLLLGFSVAFNLLASVENYAEACYHMGTALFQAGKSQEAIGNFEQALRIKPDHAEAHNNLGVALKQAGKIEEAIRHFEQALRTKPDYSNAQYNLGLALEQAGKIQEAMRQYEQVLRIKPDFAEAHNSLGEALDRTGNPKDAIGHYEEALRIKPDFAEAHNSLGIALEHAGQLKDAIGHYEEAVRINPDFAEAHFNLGDALEQEGRVEDAIRYYRRALQIDPGLTQARIRLARLPVVQ